MNKKWSFLFLLLVSVGASYAQQIKAGVKADVNFFRVYGDGMSQQFHPGVTGGFFAEIKIDNKWSIQPELLYSQRNTKTKDFSKYFSSSISLSASKDVFLSYISVPLLAKYKVNNNWSVALGPQYNYLVHADEDLLKDNKDAFKKNDFGVAGGVEYAVSKQLRFYGRFYYGVNDINNVNTFHTWNVQQFQAGLSYSLFGSR